MTDLQKAAQDVVDAYNVPVVTIETENALIDGMNALRAALQSCPDCGKPAPEGSIHTCSPQKPDSDAKQRLLEIMRRNGLATGHGDTLTQVIDTLEVELRDALTAARQDAARYRWLRENVTPVYMQQNRGSGFDDPRMKWQIEPTLISLTCIMTDITFDAAIDAAMQGDNNGTL